MVTHVVLMKFQAKDKDAQMQHARTLLEEMAPKIPSLRHLEVGLNCVPSDRAYDLALITRFDDLAGLDAYATDPVHLEVKRFLASVLETSHVVDYVTPA